MMVKELRTIVLKFTDQIPVCLLHFYLQIYIIQLSHFGNHFHEFFHLCFPLHPISM